MKNWTKSHTLLTVAILGVAGYLLYTKYGKTTSTTTTGGAMSFTGGTSYFK